MLSLTELHRTKMVLSSN